MGIVATVDTREKIINLATELIESRGYSGFSYQDIADELKIKKASIHYHFPSKEDLGLAVLEAFQKNIDHYLTMSNFESLSPTEKLAGYFEYHSDVTLDSGRVRCVCGKDNCDCNQISCIGAITSEWNVLPEKLRDFVERFNTWHVGFIMSILREGMEKGEFKKNGDLEEQALYIIASTKGAMLMARERNSMELYTKITSQVLNSVKS